VTVSASRPGHTEGEGSRVTEASTRGLFPQLTDVLHALTESHAMLLSKVQSLRDEHTNDALPVVNVMAGSADTSIGKPVDLRPPPAVEAETSPSSLEEPRAIPVYELSSSSSPSEITASVIDLTPHAAANDYADRDPDRLVTSARPISGEIASPRDRMDPVVSTQTHPQADRLEAVVSEPTHAESENRNYNFFDELDARLAGLEDAESAGGG
jgi:hypothetical protein